MTGMKEAYNPYTAGRLARREYARPGSGGRRVYSCVCVISACKLLVISFALPTFNDVGYLTLLLLYNFLLDASRRFSIFLSYLLNHIIQFLTCLSV